jgi:hypothetical protein
VVRVKIDVQRTSTGNGAMIIVRRSETEIADRQSLRRKKVQQEAEALHITPDQISRLFGDQKNAASVKQTG